VIQAGVGRPGGGKRVEGRRTEYYGNGRYEVAYRYCSWLLAPPPEFIVGRPCVPWILHLAFWRFDHSWLSLPSTDSPLSLRDRPRYLVCLLARLLRKSGRVPDLQSGCSGSNNLGLGYFASRSTQPSIPPGSANEYQLRLERQRQVWLIPLADETRGVQVKLCYPLTTP